MKEGAHPKSLLGPPSMLAQTPAFVTFEVDQESVVVQTLEPGLTRQGLGVALIVPDGLDDGGGGAVSTVPETATLARMGPVSAQVGEFLSVKM